MTVERFGLKVTHLQGDEYLVENFGRRKRMRFATTFPPRYLDDVLWMESSEDYYALESPGLRGRNVIVVERNRFLNADDYD